MRYLNRLLLSLLLVAGTAALSHAQCNFNRASRAHVFRSLMVRSYAGCPSITFPAPNSSTGTGVPTCAPPFAHSAFQFDQNRGFCRFQTRTREETPCTDGSGVPCMNVRIRAACRGVKDSSGTPTNAIGWTLSTISRATLDDPTNGDMTVIDFPVQIPFPQASNGSFRVSTDSNTILANLGLAALPGCSQLEILTVAIQDPAGSPFAKLGASPRQ